MTKNPYELRFELLSMAMSIESERRAAQMMKVENDWMAQCEAARAIADKGRDLNLPPFPTLPAVSEEDIIRTAKRLNKFISNNE